MKNIITTSIFTVALLSLSGCAMNPTRALVYSNATSPMGVTSAKSGNKRGESEKCTNILGIAATGDCSIESAMKNGGITNVTSVDWEGSNFLLIFSSGKTIVTGE